MLKFKDLYFTLDKDERIRIANKKGFPFYSGYLHNISYDTMCSIECLNVIRILIVQRNLLYVILEDEKNE